MESVLRGLYSGKIIPWERQEPRNEAINKVFCKIEDEEQYFVQRLSPDDYERLQALTRLYSELSLVEEENIFSYGFTLGMLLMMDVMKEAETIRNE